MRNEMKRLQKKFTKEHLQLLSRSSIPLIHGAKGDDAE